MILELLLLFYTTGTIKWLIGLGLSIMLLLLVTPLLVSYYVYDRLGLYSMEWLHKDLVGSSVVNIHAGFDEFSNVIEKRYDHTELRVFDFYDPEKHTELSIKRARKRYPIHSNTVPISTKFLPLDDDSVDTIMLIFAVHEIRDDDERIAFFKELSRVLHDDGRVIVVEHLRDMSNFLAYNIGFFHFLPKHTWYDTFEHAKLSIASEIKLSPFISTFILKKNGTTP